MTEILERHRSENDQHISEIRDSVFFPEGMAGRTFSAYRENMSYPLAELIELGNAVSSSDASHLPAFEAAMTHENPCVRYWGVTGCVVLGDDAKDASAGLIERLKDSEPVVQLQAARALAGIGREKIALPTIRRFLSNASSQELVLQAVLAVDECDLIKVDPELGALLKKAKGSYTKRVVEKLIRNP